jgi:glycosyltransferase involved in cell wall biosynthesis
MKINILDAGLCYRTGHHYDYDLKLAKHYTQAGHDVHAYGHAGMNVEVIKNFREFGGATKLFSIHPYQSSEEYDWYAGDIVRYRRESATIAAELRSVREADVWICPTLLAQQLDACATLGTKARIVGCVYWEPGIEARSVEAMLWRDALLSAEAAGLNFTLASVESELRHRFMPIVANGRFAVIPHPVDGPPIPEPKTDLKRIGFFGHQRDEKGVGIMKPLLSRLVADGYKVTFHNTDRNCEVPSVPGVDMLGYVEDIAVPIAECDLVVLPYNVQQYRARGSGILMECLALGIPIAAPVGTLPGRIIERFGVGPLFAVTSARFIYQAIKLAERNYLTFATNAHKAAQDFCKRNGVARFAAALLAAGK